MQKYHERTIFYKGTTERESAKGIANCKPIICIETGEVYNSMQECAKAHNCSASNIFQHIKKGTRMRNGKRFAYTTIATEVSMESMLENARRIINEQQAINDQLVKANANLLSMMNAIMNNK